MKITLAFELEERDYPKYCERVNNALEELMKDPYFLDGMIPSGTVRYFALDDTLTKFTITYP